MKKIFPYTKSFFTILFILYIFFTFRIVFSIELESKSPLDIEEVGLNEDEEFDEEFDEGFDEEFDEEFESSQGEVFDPLSGYNSVMTEFNDGFYVFILDPVARGYRWALPVSARRGVNRFFHNIFFPIRFVNNLLQLKFKNSGEELLRFCINSTVGVFGIWDPAKDWFDLEAHDEDFGQTLGYYGVGGGFHVVLPFLGPSNLRDMFSLYPDMQMDPIYYVENRSYNLPQPKGELSGYSRKNLQSAQLTILKTINRESLRIGQYQDLKKDAIELYPFLRDVYEQNRAKLIEE